VTPADAVHPASAPAPTARRRALSAVLGLAGVLALAAAGWWWLQGRWHAGTDDAYVNADVTQVAAQVGGTVRMVALVAGQPVRAGDLLVQLDDADARIAVGEAEAQLAKAVRAARGQARSADAAGTAVVQRSAEQAAAAAAVDAADVALVKARSDLAREEGLARQGFVSEQALVAYRATVAGAQAQRDQALQSLRAAGAAVGASTSQARAAAAPVAGVPLAEQPDVAMASAALRQALLNLDRTRIVAPREGVAGPRVVQPGEHVAAGAAVATVVPLGQAWVDANFKESDLAQLRVGQTATLKADAYGGGVTYHGTVVGITPATGSALSLLPAQNATGNWIKVVQRVPVRIALEPQQLQQHPLQVGLSMDVDVDLRPGAAGQGAPLAQQVAAVAPAAAAPGGDAAARAADARVAAVIAANAQR
jgi:membrane fusion protein, multidrug efflux system